MHPGEFLRHTAKPHAEDPLRRTGHDNRERDIIASDLIHLIASSPAREEQKRRLPEAAFFMRCDWTYS